MSLTKMVNGEEVACSAEEEASILAEWDAEANAVKVPQVVSFRQAKTAMQLYAVGDSDLWTVANAAADAIADPVERIKTQNLLRDSTEYERQRAELIAFASGLGLSSAQLDALFISADSFA